MSKVIRVGMWTLIVGFLCAWALVLGGCSGPSPYRQALADCAQEIPVRSQQVPWNPAWVECEERRIAFHGGERPSVGVVDMTPGERRTAARERIIWNSPRPVYFDNTRAAPSSVRVTRGWRTGVTDTGHSRGWSPSTGFGGAED